MQDRPTLTYIKDGKEKTVKHFITNHFIKELAQIRDDSFDSYIQLFKEVEYIHLKNFTFDSSRKYSILGECFEQNVIVILENCIFNCYRLCFEKINHLQLINPIFLDNCSVEFENIEDIDITLSDEGEKIELFLNDCKNITINSSPKLQKIYSHESEKIHLKNFDTNFSIIRILWNEEIFFENSNLNEYRNFYIESKKNSFKNTTIETNNSIIISAEKLILENSHITTIDSIEFSNLKELIFNDLNEDTILDTSSYLQANNYITLGKIKYIKDNTKNSLIITKENYDKDLSLSRQRLLFILKELNDKIRKNMDTELETSNETLIKEIEKIKNSKQEELVKFIEEKQKELQELITKKEKEIEKVVDYKNNQRTIKLEKQKQYLLTKKVSTITKR